MDDVELFNEVRHNMLYHKEGYFTHKHSRGRVKEGDEVGYMLDGTLHTKVKGKSYKVAQLVYLMHHKILPARVQFRDGDKLNLCLDNIIALSSAEGGVKKVNGPTFDAVFSVNYIGYYFGSYDTAEEASEVLSEAQGVYKRWEKLMTPYSWGEDGLAIMDILVSRDPEEVDDIIELYQEFLDLTQETEE